MKALFLKDWLVMKNQYKFYILLYLFIGGVGLMSDTGFINAYCMIIMSTISTNLLQNDENCRWLPYADITPLTRKQVVAEKYGMNLMLIGATCLFMTFIQVFAGLIHGNLAETMRDMVSVFCLFVAVGTLMTGISFPILFRWGTMKGKMIALVVYGGVAGIFAAGYVGMTIHWFIGGEDINIPMLAVITAVCLFVLYPLSYLLAVRWYRQRELA
ncbi:MAG: ABC-2 transporter permease [Clostridia bacterium]|nr:ABC-2 transporter permease [Clostridia bacterium]